MDAVRKRVQRDQIPHEKDAAGRVRIILDEDETLQDKGPDSAGRTTAAHEDLEDELRDRIRYLERQVEEEREARRRADTLLAQLMQRVPQLEAPQERQEPPRASEEAPEGSEPRPATGGPQEAARGPQARPWWRKLFGG